MNTSERDALIADNIALVYFTLKQLKVSIRNNNAISFGMEGLLKAAENFDKSRGFEFSTYAVPVIRNCLIRYIKRGRIIGRLTDAMNQPDTCRLTWDVAEITDDTVAKHEGSERVHEMLHQLEEVNPRAAQIVRLRFFQKLLLCDIAEIFGLTKERVRQINKSGLEWMRVNAA